MGFHSGNVRTPSKMTIATFFAAGLKKCKLHTQLAFIFVITISYIRITVRMKNAR